MSKKENNIVRPAADESQKQDDLELNKETVTDLDPRGEEGEQVKGGMPRIPNTTWTCTVGVC